MLQSSTKANVTHLYFRCGIRGAERGRPEHQRRELRSCLKRFVAMPRSPPGHAEDLRIGLLGRFWVQVGSRRIPQFLSRRKSAQLVKLLVLAPGHRRLREELQDILWPEATMAVAANNLHRTLHTARHLLEPALTPAARSAYLRLEGHAAVLHGPRLLWIDLEAFEVAAVVARRTQATAAYEAALGLFTGDLLPDDPDEEWAVRRREHVRSLYLDLLLDAARLHETRGAAEAAIPLLQQIVLVEPIHEDAHRRLMRLRAEAGDPQRALQQYARLCEILRRELDVEPDPDTELLHRDILSGRFRPLSPAAETARLVGRQAWSGAATTAPSSPGPAALSERERQIVELVGRELTNRQIATQLGLSKRTVDTHVSHILRKLGKASRRQVAQWAVEHGLLRTHRGARGTQI
jgi:DNA-binding SARP family transcriptional activator/DNA-binding CsgD family transcriptional regulator